jgi:hypothetical protein
VSFRPLHTLLLAALLWLAPSPAQAELFDEVLAAHHQAEALLRTRQAELSVYVSGVASGLLLRKAELQIDDAPAQHYTYSRVESEALQRGGLHRLHVTQLERGMHRLRARVLARRIGAAPGTPYIELQIDETFEKGGVSLALELTVPPDWQRPWARLGVLRSDGPSDALRQRVERFAEDAQWYWVAAAEGPRGAALPPPARASALVGHYNAALVLLKNKRTKQGIAKLTQIGTADVDEADELRVRDLANLALGYRMLRDGNGPAASVALGRVRSDGPYAHPALLGLGWASLLPSGSRVRAAAQDVDADQQRRMPLQHSWTAGVKLGERNLRAALVPWTELAQRNPFDPVAQEGLLLVAYALQQLRAHERAEVQYQLAAARLAGVVRQIDAALQAFDDGRIFALIDAESAGGWRRWLADLPADGETGYFRLLAADADFIDALEARQPLLYQQRLLARHARDLEALAQTDATAAALRTRILALSERVAAPLAQASLTVGAAAQRVLLDLRVSASAYLADANLALARIYDPQAAR